MIYPSEDKLAKQVGSRYTLVILAAKRAKQLREGAPKLIDTTSTNPITIALEEIAQGKIHFSVADNDELPVTSIEPELEATELSAVQEEAAEITGEAPAPVDEASRIAELLKVPMEDEEEIEAEADEEDLPDLLAPSEDDEIAVPEEDQPESAE